MGGRGSKSGSGKAKAKIRTLFKKKDKQIITEQPKTEQPKTKQTTKAKGGTVKQAKEHIKHQIGIDVEKYTTNVFGNKRTGFVIDKSKMSKNDYNSLKTFANKTQKGYGSFKITIMDNGAWSDFVKVEKRK